VEICVAAHFGRGGTTYAGLLARLGSPARPGLLARSGSPARSGLLARSSLLSSGLLARSGLLAGLSWTWDRVGDTCAQPPPPTATPRFTGRFRWSAPLRRPVSDGRTGGEGVEVWVPHAATNRDLGPG